MKLTPFSSIGIGFEPEDVAELGAAFADAEAQAVGEPAGRGLAGAGEPAAAEGGKARIGDALVAVGDQWTASVSSRSIAIARRRR